jgi:hypothetical protein
MKDLQNKFLTAKKARKLIKKRKKLDDFSSYISIMDSKIREACSLGKNTIQLWPINVKDISDSDIDIHYDKYTMLSNVIIPELRKHYINNGFEIIQVDNPDPGHPASSDYEYMQW